MALMALRKAKRSVEDKGVLGRNLGEGAQVVEADKSPRTTWGARQRVEELQQTYRLWGAVER